MLRALGAWRHGREPWKVVAVLRYRLSVNRLTPTSKTPVIITVSDQQENGGVLRGFAGGVQVVHGWDVRLFKEVKGHV
eukprot:763285-Hanusia_phi.AAC.2